MKLKVKKLTSNAVLPYKTNPGDAAYDLTAINIKTVNEGGHGYIEYDFGISIELPENYAGFIFPRSSISKTGLWLANSIGVIDSSFRGSITARFKYIPGTDLYKIGDRVAQLIVQKVEELEFEESDNLSESTRGTGSYGSTGS